MIGKKTLLSANCLSAMFGVFALAACQSADRPEIAKEPDTTTPKQKCSAPPKVPDIWALETMLTESGDIKAGMSKEQKEAVIREYIRDKNQRFIECNKRSSK